VKPERVPDAISHGWKQPEIGITCFGNEACDNVKRLFSWS